MKMPHCSNIIAAVSGKQASSQGSANSRRQAARRVGHWRVATTSRNTIGIDQTTRCATTCKLSSGSSRWT